MALSVLHDARYAIRSLVRRPLFTAVILLTLALGIGSNVAIFSVANAVLFRPLPFKDPEELAFVWTRLPATNVARSLVSGPDFRDYQQESTRFQGFAGAVAVPGTLTGDGDPERITNAYVTWNLFDLLGVRPILGRAHVADDAFAMDPKAFGNPNPDLPPGKVVLSYELWQRRFGGDRSVIGRTIQMDGFGSVVVGVLPPNFRIYLPADAGMPTNIDAWGVLPSNIGDFERQAAWLTVVTRLKKGVTLAQAQQDMNGIATRLRELHQFHATQNMQIVVAGMHRDAGSTRVQRCSRSWAPSVSCCSSRAPTSRICSSLGRPNATARWPCVRPSAAGAVASLRKCSRRAWCSPWPARSSVCCSPGRASA